MDLLLKARPHATVEFVFRAEVAVYMFADEDRLESCVAENDARGKETVEDGESDLYCWFISFDSLILASL